MWLISAILVSFWKDKQICYGKFVSPLTEVSAAALFGEPLSSNPGTAALQITKVNTAKASYQLAVTKHLVRSITADFDELIVAFKNRPDDDVEKHQVPGWLRACKDCIWHMMWIIWDINVSMYHPEITRLLLFMQSKLFSVLLAQLVSTNRWK